MAILGFHVVASLIAITIFSKVASRFSFVSLYVVNGLYRYISPSNDALRALLPSSKEKLNPRHRRKKREEEETEGFKVPKALPFQLELAPVTVGELQRFPMYTSVHWLSLFTPICLLVYGLSEVFIYMFPTNADVNISLVWLILGLGFVLQVLAKLTAWLFLNEDERSLLISFAAIYFLFSCIFTMFSDRIFDVHLLKAFDHFGENVNNFLVHNEIDVTVDSRLKSPVLLYISMSTFFALLSSMLVFPSIRFATMYTHALEMASPLMKLMLHISFLSPSLVLLLFFTPLKEQLVHGRRALFTEPQMEIVRVYAVIFVVAMRLITKRVNLQSHLDLAHEKVQLLRKESGYVKNYDLQALIFRYYSYFCAAVVQYFAPVLLTLLFALLMKSSAGMSWLGVEPNEADLDEAARTVSPPLGAFRSLFDATVCRSLWSFCLLFTTFANFSLSIIGLFYNALSVR